MSNNNNEKIAAATFKKVIEFFQNNPALQNIDLMDNAGFCRNCISKWYSASAEELGEKIDYEEARNIVYGMPYKEWKRKYQKEQPSSRLENFKKHDH